MYNIQYARAFDLRGAVYNGSAETGYERCLFTGNFWRHFFPSITVFFRCGIFVHVLTWNLKKNIEAPHYEVAVSF